MSYNIILDRPFDEVKTNKTIAIRTKFKNFSN